MKLRRADADRDDSEDPPEDTVLEFQSIEGRLKSPVMHS